MLLSKLWREERGQGMAEYGLILALVAVVCLIAFETLGKNINEKVDEVGTKIGETSSGESGTQ